jgi:hypothetical protein
MCHLILVVIDLTMGCAVRGAPRAAGGAKLFAVLIE